MRTDLAGQHLQLEKAEGKNAAVVNNDDRGVKGIRKSLHTLQEAAGDKENLVGGGRIKQMAILKDKPAVVLPETKNAKKIKSSKTIVVEDLTSEAGPSKDYWEIIAERRRVALEEALRENQELHERISILEEENAQCKVLLEDTQALVETLTEMLHEEPAADKKDDSTDSRVETETESKN